MGSRSRIVCGSGLFLYLSACAPSEEPSGGAARSMLDAPAPVAADDSAGEEPGTFFALELPDDAPVVAFLGDSVCAGLHLAEDDAFPSVLQRRLHEEGLSFKLVSSCESGRTTAGGRSALSWVLRSEPDVLVVGLGANDGLRGIELAEVESNLRGILEGAREAGARVLLLGIRIPPNYGQYAEDFDALYPALAAEYDTAFVPFYMEGVGGVAEMNLPDGLHPTQAGQRALADNVQPGLEAVLRDLAAN